MTILSASLSTLWLAAFWLLTRDRATTLALTLAATIACMISIAIASTSIWASITAGYANDSYWTLSKGGRIGVLAISTVGLALFFVSLAWKSRIILGLRAQISATAWVLFDIAFGWLAFGVLHTISPQLFYSFYRLIFDYLPNQWVIDSILDVETLSLIAQLSSGGSLSDHLAGVALWAIVPFTLWLHLRYWWRG